MKVGLIIPTVPGARQHYVENALRQLKVQTRQPDRLYLVQHAPTSSRLDIVARIRAGVASAKKDGLDRVLIWDDDDYYDPTYIATMMDNWKDELLIADRWQMMYHLKFRKWSVWEPNSQESRNNISMHSLGFRLELMDILGWPDDATAWPDRYIWTHPKLPRGSVVSLYIPCLCISMKHGVGKYVMQSHVSNHESIWMYPDEQFIWLKKFVDPRFVPFYVAESVRLRTLDYVAADQPNASMITVI